jgi:sortase A
MGYRGTWSRMVFYNLDKLNSGDEVLLKDRSGQLYRYRVSEVFTTDPGESWVMGQVRGRDMVTLQTCTPIPTFQKRLIVRADRV